MALADIITLSRVTLLEAGDDFYRVRYNNQEYSFKNSFETASYGSANGGTGMRLSQELRQEMRPLSGFYIDEQIREEQKDLWPIILEVMALHEIRESEYKEAGFEDAHQRAVKDEILYVTKFWDMDKRERYLAFAQEYRSTNFEECSSDKKSPVREILDPDQYRALYATIKGLEGSPTPEEYFGADIVSKQEDGIDRVGDPPRFSLSASKGKIIQLYLMGDDHYNNVPNIKKLEHLRALEWSEFNIPSEQHTRFSKFELYPELRCLNLQMNNIRGIVRIENMKKLKTLCLGINGIQEIRFGTGLDHLTHLDLSQNPLKVIEGSGNLPNLELLSIGDGSQLRVEPQWLAELGKLEKLKTMYIYGYVISQDNLDRFNPEDRIKIIIIGDHDKYYDEVVSPFFDLSNSEIP